MPSTASSVSSDAEPSVESTALELVDTYDKSMKAEQSKEHFLVSTNITAASVQFQLVHTNPQTHF